MVEHASHCPKLPWMIDFFSTENGLVPKTQLKAAYASNHLDYLKNLNFESEPSKKRLTSIICTIGPKSMDVDVLERMLDAGMNVARLKMPFFSQSECEQALLNIRTASDNFSKRMGSMYPVAIAVDLRGPEIRTGSLKDPSAGNVKLQLDNETLITSDPAYEEHVTENMIYVDYQKITEIVEPGDKFCLDNHITLSALEIVGSFIRCIITRAGQIGDHVSVSLDSSVLDLPTVSEIEVSYAKDMNVDIVFVSSVRDKAVLQEVKRLLGTEGQAIQVVAKIENAIAVKNIDEIVQESDGILISRNDLAADIPQQKLFLVQKAIIATCNKAGKPVICSPQMLESMVSAATPTRAEINDVATAVIDGVDCLMLSRETACGGYPVEAVRTLASICLEAEAAIYQRQVFQDLAGEPIVPFEPIYALAIGIVETSIKCSAAAIILLTTSGRTAKVVAKYRPRCPIVALTRCGRVARQLRMHRGIEPIQFIAKPLTDWGQDVRKRIQLGITYGKYHGFIRGGDTILVVKGSRPGTGFTNCMHVYYASDFDSIEEQSTTH